MVGVGKEMSLGERGGGGFNENVEQTKVGGVRFFFFLLGWGGGGNEC